MFERLQHSAREAVAHARDEADRAGHQVVGAEHLLLGLLARPGPAADALKAAGADPDELRAQLSARAAAAAPESPDAAQTGQDSAGLAAAAAVQGEGEVGEGADIPMTREARRALELAGRAAQRLRHPRVSSGHLLLGVIDQPDSPAVQALTVAGIHVGTLRTDVLRRVTEGGGDRFG
jgi:ATP-dependent Clp protease ATP-binding subunit ClpA